MHKPLLPSGRSSGPHELDRDDRSLNVLRRESGIADLSLAQLAVGAMPGHGMEAAPAGDLEDVDRSAGFSRLEDGALEFGEKCGASEMG